MRSFLKFTSIAALSIYAASALAQSPDMNKARAYYFAAQEAFEVGKFQDALNAVDLAEQTSGQTGPKLLSLRTQIYYGMGDYDKAKSEMDKFYASGASEADERDMAPLLLKIDDKLAEQARQDAAAAAANAEAERVAALEAPEKSLRATILDSSGDNQLSGTLYANGTNGSDGRNGSTRSHDGGDGGHGGSGLPGANLRVFIEQIDFQHIPDLARITLVNSNGRKWSGYWDTSKELTFEVSGGDGGDGGDGADGRDGRDGNDAYDRYGAAGNGQSGGDGGNGGNAGQGGNGGTLETYYIGNSEFSEIMRSKYFVNRNSGSAGQVGRRGGYGYGGKGGKYYGGGRFAAHGSDGSDGMRGREGFESPAGKNGQAPMKNSTESVFLANDIRLHKTPGSIPSQMPLNTFLSNTRSLGDAPLGPLGKSEPKLTSTPQLSTTEDTTVGGMTMPTSVEDKTPSVQSKSPLGMRVSLIDGFLKVHEVEAGQIASMSGISAGDQIYAINGTPILGKTFDQAIAEMQKVAETSVKLTVKSPVGTISDIQLRRPETSP